MTWETRGARAAQARLLRLPPGRRSLFRPPQLCVRMSQEPGSYEHLLTIAGAVDCERFAGAALPTGLHSCQRSILVSATTARFRTAREVPFVLQCASSP